MMVGRDDCQFKVETVVKKDRYGRNRYTSSIKVTSYVISEVSSRYEIDTRFYTKVWSGYTHNPLVKNTYTDYVISTVDAIITTDGVTGRLAR